MDWSLNRVELAVLGTLAINPGEHSPLVKLLRPEDFSQPWHGDVLAWVRHRAARPRDVDAKLFDPVPGWAQADPSRVGQLLDAAGPPDYLPEYVRLVLERSIARAIAGVGVVLHAGALSASLHGDLETFRYSVRVVSQVVDDCRLRLAILRSPEDLARFDLAELGSTAGLTAVRLSAERAIGAVPMAVPAQVEEAERRFVAALVNHPDRAARWTAAIGSPSIVSRPWRTVFQALERLVAEQRPIDLSTVAAEMSRGLLVNGPGPLEGELRAWVDNGVADDPDFWGRRVAANRLRRGGRGAARSLHEAADNPGVSVDDMIDTAEILCLALTEAAKLVEPPPSNLRRLPRQLPPGASPSAGIG